MGHGLVFGGGWLVVGLWCWVVVGGRWVVGVGLLLVVGGWLVLGCCWW